MGFRTSLFFVALCIAAASAQFATQFNAPHSFAQKQNDDAEDSVTASANVQFRVRPYNNFNQQASQEEEDEEEDEAPPPTYQRRAPVQNQYRKPVNIKNNEAISEEELEEEEPDRLTLLLEKSSFSCAQRVSGYYADEGVGCEVFHYCNENQKHSWICPEGFIFHQVHLICMPPSSDNICEQSSKYTFVNDYLYKPINMEEHQQRPNISLRYSERYYPESFYLDERHEQDPEEQHQQQRQRQPIQVGLRKPVQQQQQQQHHTTSQPIYRAPTPTPQQNVYRSPEDINISLQQRRPVLFAQPTTPRYEDEEYNYE